MGATTSYSYAETKACLFNNRLNEDVASSMSDSVLLNVAIPKNRLKRVIIRLPCTPSPKTGQAIMSRDDDNALDQRKVHFSTFLSKESKENFENESEDWIDSEKLMRPQMLTADQPTKKLTLSEAGSPPLQRVIRPSACSSEEFVSFEPEARQNPSFPLFANNCKSEPYLPSFTRGCKVTPDPVLLPLEELSTADRLSPSVQIKQDYSYLTPSFRESIDTSDSSTPKTRNSWLESPTTSVTQPSVQYTPSRDSTPPGFPNIVIDTTPARRNRSPASDGIPRRFSKTPTSGSEMGRRNSAYTETDIPPLDLAVQRASTPNSCSLKEGRSMFSKGKRAHYRPDKFKTKSLDALEKKFTKLDTDSKRKKRKHARARSSSMERSRLKKYEISKKSIGKGASARVKIAKHKGTKQIVAVKIINKASMKRKKRIGMKGKGTTSQWENVLQEISIMNMLSRHPHQNVVQLYEVIDARDKLHIFMELLPGGPVMAGKAEVEPFKDMERIRRYLRDLVMGLEYLHAVGVVHMDIKPENLLLDSDDRLKIIDFGVAMIVKGEGKIRKYQGTPAFTPPETIADGPFMPWPLDVWAVGVTLYIFGHGSPPFHEEGISFEHLYNMIQNEEPKFNTALDAEYISCIESCLEKNPDERTTLRGLRTHQWLTKNGKDPLPKQDFPKLRLASDDCKSPGSTREICNIGCKSRGKRKA